MATSEKPLMEWTLEDAASATGVSVEQLLAAGNQQDNKRYKPQERGPEGMRRTVYYPKRGGAVRIVSDQLNKLLRAYPAHDCAFGFEPDGGIIRHAMEHVGQLEVWKVDYKSAFESFSRQQAIQVLAEIFPGPVASAFAGVICVNNHLATGNPAVPHLFNLALRDLHEQLDKLAQEEGLLFTAYADDNYFSGDLVTASFQDQVCNLMRRSMFKPHAPGVKNRVMRHGEEDVIVTGLLVTLTGVRLPQAKLHEALAIYRQVTSGHDITQLSPYFQLCIEDDPFGLHFWGQDTARNSPSALGFLHSCMDADRTFRKWLLKRLKETEIFSHFERAFGSEDAGRLLTNAQR